MSTPVGVDIRKAVASGFPAQNAIASDLYSGKPPALDHEGEACKLTR